MGHIVAYLGRISMVKLIVNYPRAKFYLTDMKGQTVLEVAEQSGNGEIIKMVKMGSFQTTPEYAQLLPSVGLRPQLK